MLRKKLALIAMAASIITGCSGVRNVYENVEETYQKVKSTTEEYGVSVNRKRVKLTVPEKFIPVSDRFSPKLTGRVELNNVGYDLRNVRIGRISARLNLSF